MSNKCGIEFLVLNYLSNTCFYFKVVELWRSNMKHQDADETLRKDIISHFALRLVYCREYVLATIVRQFYTLHCQLEIPLITL